VAICTYDRAASLRRTLASLRDQAGIAGLAWELLVVDNNSLDATPAVAEAAAASLPLRYVTERQQGLSHARNRALEEFAGEALLFTDDDVVLDRGWLSAYAGAVERHAGASYFGGRVLPLWEGARPSWLRDEGMALIAGVLVHYDLGTEDREYRPDDPLPFGASFGLRRELARRVGGFRTDLGVVGRSPGRSEETAWLEAAVASGARGAYVGSALARHQVDGSRLRARYLFRHGIHKGVAIARTGDARGLASMGRMVLFLAKAAVQLAKGRGDRARQCVINAGIQLGMVQESGRAAAGGRAVR
jgi:glycosyltransferase involved in cell wall biosynthesis